MSLSDYPFIGRLVRALIVLALIGIALNDGIRLSSALSKGGDALNDAMAAAIDIVMVTPDAAEEAQTVAATAAEAGGATLEEYAQESGKTFSIEHVKIELAISTPLQSTIVVGPVWALIKGTDPGAPRILLRQTKQVDVMGNAN
jgi:hypothetical protein